LHKIVHKNGPFTTLFMKMLICQRTCYFSGRTSDALKAEKQGKNFDYQIIKLHFQGCLRGKFLGKNHNEKQL